MARQADKRTSGASAESIVTLVIGALLVAYGLATLLLTGSGFAADPIDGTVSGDTWLGIEGNGWTQLLFLGVGLLVVAGSPRRTSARAVAVLGGLILGAASVIAMVDRTDVFGIFAANGATMLVWGVAAVLLLAVALSPRPSEQTADPYAAERQDDWPSRFDRSPRDREPARRRTRA